MRVISVLKRLFVVAALIAIMGSYARQSARSAEPTNVSAGDALKQLMAGNERFVAGKLHAATPEEVAKRRAEVAHSQHPIAIIVCCSDSRVGPESVFDQGIGEVFVVRTAGEVIDNTALGSIEYAVQYLGAPLIVVLGHERCGAVKAAVDGAKVPGHIADVLKAIEPAVKETKGQPGDPVDNAIRANVRDVTAQLQSSGPILAEQVKSGRITVVGAYVSLDTGKVELLEQTKK